MYDINPLDALGLSRYAKFIVALLGLVVVVLGTLTDVSWAPPVAAGVSAVLVYLVPNKG